MIKKVILLLSIISLNACAIAQKTASKKAQEFYIDGNRYMRIGEYTAAETMFLKAISKDENFADPKLDLATLYLMTGSNEEAKKLMLDVASTYPSYDSRVHFSLGYVYQIENDYLEAKKHFQNFLKYTDPRNEMVALAQVAVQSCDFAVEAIKNPVPFEPINLGALINSENDEYFPVLTADESLLMFTRALPTEANNPMGFNEDFFFSKNQDGEWTQAYNPGRPINTNSNEGAPALSPDGKYIIFTACDVDGSLNYGPGRKGLGSCDLFVSQRVGDRWTSPQNMGRTINSPAWETQPSFASDGKTLYFIRGKSRGGSKQADIFMSELTENGWSKAERLPGNINTSQSEESVFIHPDNQTLYFSSNGHIGMGDMDIYMSRRQPDGSWGDPINLGYPINTSGHENSFHVAPNGKYALIGSDREGGFGGMDLYKFDLPESARPKRISYLKGTIRDINTKKPLEARFELIDVANDSIIAQAYSDPENGNFLVVLPESDQYALFAEKSGYLDLSENIVLENMDENLHFERSFFLKPIEKGSSIVLKNVFFDTDKFDLKSESKTELNKLYSMLNRNPNLKIEIAGHTDNVGSASDNQLLSENRAKAVYEYLISRGIDAARMNYVGYGSEKPIASNDTEEGRAQNRRTEYTITE